MTLNAANEQPRIGSIGTGVMGASMCSHLMNVGYQMAVHTRTREKAAPLELEADGRGHRPCSSPLRRCRRSDWDGDTEIT